MLLAIENVEVYDSPGSYGRGPETHVVGNDMLIIGVPRAMRESLRISGRWDDENSRATVEFGGNSIKVQVVFTSERLLASGPFAATNTDCHCWMTPHVREMLRLTRAHAPERAGFENFSAKWSSVTVSVNGLLFSYGSNGRKQLRGRIERPLDEPFQTYPACLTGYRRIFCGKSANWGGGFASVHPVIGGETYGNVASLSHKEFLKLDAFEGGYRRQVVTVNLQDSGESVQAITYIANDPTFVQPPSQAYLTAIQIMLRERDERACDTTIDRLRIGRDGNLQASLYFVSRPRDPLLTLCLLQAIEGLGPWRHPGLFHLDLPSLIIEANSRLAKPFKMPQDMRRIVQHLALHYPSVTTLQSLRCLPLEEILGSLGLDGDVAEFAQQLSSYGERAEP